MTTSATARVLLGAVVVVYVVHLTRLTVDHHDGFATMGFDLGIFDQGVWLLSRFQDPFVTVRGLHLFGDHASFVLLGLVPIYWVAASPAVLLGAQSLALGAGAIPTFLLARRLLRSEWAAVLCAVAYLAHPVIAWTNFENFHPDAFEVPLVILAFYLVTVRRWRWFTVCVAALLLVKEDVALLTFVLGLYVARYHHRAVGVATAAASAGWFLVAWFVVLPTFHPGGPLYTGRLPLTRFGGAGGFLQALVTRPWEIAGLAFGTQDRWYLWQLFASFGLLSLLAPPVLLVAVGPLVINLLSSFPYQTQIQYHYATLIVPVLTVAAISGVARFRSKRLRHGLVAAMAVAAVACAFLWGPLGRNPRAIADPASPRAQAARTAIALIPPGAVVSASYSYVPHLTHRTQIYEFPNPWRATNWGDGSEHGSRLPAAADVEYLLLGTSTVNDTDARLVERLEATDFHRLFESQGILLLGRTHTPKDP